MHGSVGHGSVGIVSPLARQRGLAAAGRVVEIETLELVRERRRDSEIRIGQPVGRDLDVARQCREPAVNRPIALRFDQALSDVARIERESALTRQAVPAVGAKFEP